MINIRAIILIILNAYILYNIFNTRGYKYALVFSFVWDMIYFTIYNRGLTIPIAIILMLITALECLLKVSIDYFVYKKTNNFWIFLILSIILEFITTYVLLLVLSTIISIF